MSDGIFTSAVADVYDRVGEFIGTKTLLSYDNERSINDWLIETRKRYAKLKLGFLSTRSHDVQDINTIYIKRDKALIKSARGSWITDSNLVEASVYVAVCHCIEVSWLNDRDQFLCPNDGWKKDADFRANCLVFTLFSNANYIRSADGVNHWIPFTEEEVGAKDCFKSHFMSEFIGGHAGRPPYQRGRENVANVETANANTQDQLDIGNIGTGNTSTLATFPNLSPTAASVLNAGRELWRYYHSQPGANPDASYYDIRLHFQGVTVDARGKAKMNSDSKDAKYTELIGNLRAAMKRLAKEIEPKVYEYGFLRR